MRNSFVTSSHVNLPWFAVLVATIAVLCQKVMLRTSAFFTLTKLFTTVHIFRELARSNGFWIPLSLSRESKPEYSMRSTRFRAPGGVRQIVAGFACFESKHHKLGFARNRILGFPLTLNQSYYHTFKAPHFISILHPQSTD